MVRFYLPIVCLLVALSLLPARAQPPTAVADTVPMATKKTLPARLTPATYTRRQIMVGNGGGFTGFSTTYYLLDNGQLFGRHSRDTTYQFLGKQSVARTKRAFATVEKQCRIKSTRFDKPGNTYRFVGWKKGQHQHRVTWGAAGTTVPAAYPKFYNSFMATLPSSMK